MSLVLKATTNPGTASWGEEYAGITSYFIVTTGTADPDNQVYSTFEAAHAAAVASDFIGPKIIYFAPGTHTITTAGTYNMLNIQLAGFSGASATPSIVYPTVDGVVLTNVFSIQYLLLASASVGTNPWITYTPDVGFIPTLNILNTLILATTAPVFGVSGAGSCSFRCIQVIFNSIASAAIRVENTTGFTLYLFNLSLLTANSLESEAGTTITVYAYGVPEILDQTQPSVLGTLDYISMASVQSYTPSTVGDWLTAPVSTQEALDRLASAVEGLLGAPIP